MGRGPPLLRRLTNGVEVSQRLRDNPVTAAIPIVVVSAQDRLQATGAAHAGQ